MADGIAQAGGSGLLFNAQGQPVTQAQTNEIMRLIQAYEAGDQASGQAAVQWGQALGIDLNSAISNLRQQTGPNAAPTPSTLPEQNALQQLAQIDPTGEALRNQLGSSYLSTLRQTGAPTADQFKSYLNLYSQVDPTGAAARQQLMSDLASQEALGTQLDPATQREVEQATRGAQSARGNVYGTPQLVREAMTRGQAGLALQQQRQQALQGYLASGQTPGDIALGLYNQQLNQLRASQGAAQGYLASGTTPYQAGASYVDRAQAAAAAAAQGGAAYNPSGLAPSYAGAGAPSFPQYGLDVSQLSGSWYNNINSANLQAYNLQQAYKKQGGGSSMYGGIGSAVGGILGGVVGSVVPGVGTAIGGLAGSALGGAAGQAAGSYFS